MEAWNIQRDPTLLILVLHPWNVSREHVAHKVAMGCIFTNPADRNAVFGIGAAIHILHVHRASLFVQVVDDPLAEGQVLFWVIPLEVAFPPALVLDVWPADSMRV